MAVRRFIDDRVPHPTTIYSDNVTNLVAAEKELNEGIKNLNSKLIANEMIDRGINWKFSPPTGVHYVGVWEKPFGVTQKVSNRCSSGALRDRRGPTHCHERSCFSFKTRQLIHLSRSL